MLAATHCTQCFQIAFPDMYPEVLPAPQHGGAKVAAFVGSALWPVSPHWGVAGDSARLSGYMLQSACLLG